MSSLPQFTLYALTATEITAAAASAARRHPELAGRIGKAADILASGALQLDATAWECSQLARWVVPSQSRNGAYVINGLACPCEDGKYNHVSHCKHSIAVGLYAKILANKFNESVCARGIDLGILPDRTFNAYAKRMGMVHVHRMGSAYVFCDAASMVHFSIWLAKQAQPVAVEWPTLAQVAA